MNITETTWTGAWEFDASALGFTFHLDGQENVEIERTGPGPKIILLNSLSTCSGIDVVATLKKMRVDLKSLNIKATGSLSEEHPKVYTMIHLVFEAGVAAADVPKVERAIQLSLTTYCGVAAMLGKTATITSEVVVV